MEWFRWWHGTVNDEKLRVVASEAERPVIEVLGAWAYLLEFASKNEEERGSLEGVNFKIAAFTLETSQEIFSSIYSKLCEFNIISSDNRLVNWDKRQRKREDDSAERTRKYRERQKENGCDAPKRSVTQCDASEKTREEKTREEKSKTRARGNDEDRVFLDRVVESFQEILPELVPNGGVNISATLKKQILARRRERADRKQVEWWSEYWRSIRDRPFLMGQTKEGFLAGIVFLTRKSKMDAVLSGEYRGKSQANKPVDQGLAEKDYSEGLEEWNRRRLQ